MHFPLRFLRIAAASALLAQTTQRSTTQARRLRRSGGNAAKVTAVPDDIALRMLDGTVITAASDGWEELLGEKIEATFDENGCFPGEKTETSGGLH